MDELDLLDWRRRVSDLYAGIRAASDPEAGWHRWCETRQLFREHPQSPVPTDAPPANRLDMRVEAGERLDGA